MEKTMYRDGSGEVIFSSSRELNPREKSYTPKASYELAAKSHPRPRRPDTTANLMSKLADLALDTEVSVAP